MTAPREWLDRLVTDAHVIELRVKTPNGWRSGLYDDVGRLWAEIQRCERAGLTCYTSLNRPRPDLEATNDFGAAALRDADIVSIRRIVFDLDPVRPRGTPSTDAELQAAEQVARDLVTALASAGWPTPARGISGNGAHVVYRTACKATPAWRQAMGVLYMALRDRLAESCREAGVHFDPSVRNPARIWRVYGTTNRKGEATPDRPHRKAEILLPAGAWQTVKADTIQRTVDAWTPVVGAARPMSPRRPAPRGRGDYRTLDVVAWFQARGAYLRPLADGKHAAVCPWHSEHSERGGPMDTSTVIFEASGGWPGFRCLHAHCDHRRLADVMTLWGDADQFCAAEWEGRRHGR